MIKRTVTAKKLAANQGNSKRSTGPRTERGKSASRFNAVKCGLFADEVVIPDCDGEDARQNFSELLLDLQHEFEPVGRFENMLVEKIAECFWRLRRTTRAESGATRVQGFWDKSFKLPEGSFIDRLNRSVDFERFCLSALNGAREEIGRTGKLSAESYKKIRLLVEDPPSDPPSDKNSDLTPEPVIDKNPDVTSEPVVDRNSDTAPEPVIDDEFVERIEKKIELFQFTVLQVDSRVATRLEDCVKQGSLPLADEIEKIYRCRMRTEKELDWALGKLFFLQKNRSHRKQRR